MNRNLEICGHCPYLTVKSFFFIKKYFCYGTVKWTSYYHANEQPSLLMDKNRDGFARKKDYEERFLPEDCKYKFEQTIMTQEEEDKDEKFGRVFEV